MDKPYQRRGSKSNAQVGREFVDTALELFASQGLSLKPEVSVPIGINKKKPHRFDLGDIASKILVECKTHKWTEGKNVPSAKLVAWNEAMFYFYTSPPGFRKILFVLRDYSQERSETLGQYYVRTYSHLIPDDVEIWEYSETDLTAAQIH